MPANAVGPLILFLALLLAAAHLLGHLFTRLRQPRVIGEILSGIMLGPFVLGKLPGYTRILQLDVDAAPKKAALDLMYQMGLLLLMFLSGAETKALFRKHEWKQIAWLTTVGTGLPFVATGLCVPLVPSRSLLGTKGNVTALVLVVSIAVAVTSIPVISRIFLDLRILQTRFARLVLGVAVLEDIFLWAVLAVATTIAGASAPSWRQLSAQVGVTVTYFVLGLSLVPAAIKRISKAHGNVLAECSPVAYALLIAFAYVAAAGLLNVSLVFAAFLAGFAVSRKRQRDALETISRFSFGLFIPIYFALVGYSLVFDRRFSIVMLACFLGAGCALKVSSVALGARLAGFIGLDVVNLAIATNARGGPGIVLASVAFQAGIINAAFYTTLVLVAILTSQAAGAWLEFVLRRGWPLLASDQQVRQSLAGVEGPPEQAPA
jgi:Kef-type K+ transport system membrane component KefB